MMSRGDDLVLLTGISGFIAKHIALRLLSEGYRVRGTVRSLGKVEAVRKTLGQHGADLSRLEFVDVDLTGDGGWDAAVDGVRFVQHAASPFPAKLPAERTGLVPVARGGTLRVIEAAKRAGVQRIVVTSSVAAVYYGHDEGRREFTEADWSVVESRAVSPYSLSKTLAERAAWDAVADSGIELVTVNPSLVLGPLLDAQFGTSANIIAMMMKGRMPFVPNAAFGIVDVRDVSNAHVAAMRVQEAAGRRFILSAGSLSLMEIGAAISTALPAYQRKMPKALLPDALVRLVAVFSRQVRQIVPELGRRKTLISTPARDVLGLSLQSPESAVAATARSLSSLGLV